MAVEVLVGNNMAANVVAACGTAVEMMVYNVVVVVDLVVGRLFHALDEVDEEIFVIL